MWRRLIEVRHDADKRSVYSDHRAGSGYRLRGSFAVAGWLDFELYLRGLVCPWLLPMFWREFFRSGLAVTWDDVDCLILVFIVYSMYI